MRFGLLEVLALASVPWCKAQHAQASPSVSETLEATSSVYSMNVTECPGYSLSALTESEVGLTAQLTLAGPACNAFGKDIVNLSIEVVYQSLNTLHVKISDTLNQQFTIPESIVTRPSAPDESYKATSDLVFNYDPSPFAFWITRRLEPDAIPLFDTRTSSLPPTPIPPLNASDPSTAFDAFPLVFEDQYLQVASALPYDTNIYGLGEVIASSGFRRDTGVNGVGTVQTNWNRDIEDPIDQNMYGTHPIYVEHRFNETTNKSSSSGVLLLSAAGADILLQTPPNSNVSFIEYRMIGGILDFYFFSGPTPADVIAQYGAIIGYPMWQPIWGFGFHLCRWGYSNISEVTDVVSQMRAANIPLEVQWTDIDLYHAYRDFTTDPVSFPPEEVQLFVENLASNYQHYIPIVDAALAVTVNSTDVYNPYTRGVEEDVWIKNPDGSLYVGEVWPGYTVFPDWFSENIQSFWTEALKNWSALGVGFSGIWLDMNEASSFCNNSCGSGANYSALTPMSMVGRVITEYPECLLTFVLSYNATIWGPSGNMTINGTSTNSCTTNAMTTTVTKRGLGSGQEPGISINSPPYAIHNAIGALSTNTLATNATHYGGYAELDVHNMFGLMEEKTTNLALQEIFPDKRPFLISRSTFVSAGKWTGHWLGDNYSKWQYMYLSIQGMLQFQIYQIPMVGADTCGFLDNTDEELCNRWMQLSAFTPFYRNHNTYGAIPQEPYRWPSVANASRTAIAARYSLLPYWYTIFANASLTGLPPMKALFYEFPDEPELFAVDRQWMVGKHILVTPVLTPGATTVDGIFPGGGSVVWRDWYTHAVVNATIGGNTTLDAPLGHINVHIRDNSALLLHQQPAYTIHETREGPYALLVSLTGAGTVFGIAYLDDGISPPPTSNRTVTFLVVDGTLSIKSGGTYDVEQKLSTVTVLGAKQPSSVVVNGEEVHGWAYTASIEELVVSDLAISLEEDSSISWK
ncbi:glycoside hydrolase family 31 protein [Hydnomerulius pinastri MD-312]|uniref:Glycoside hydrolase family 31 protein n=1 Tax=Hydnomerulius pinastri MD-312 TaxID=994086 RepID=A0A0C9VZX5_9AGAM|nr:glycoside hydrolase family 31 protein [Hydnomerulius pinastri MD-312]